MKTNLPPIAVILGTILACAILPASAAAATIVVSVAGMTSIFAADYAEVLKPERIPAPIIPLPASHSELAELRAAA